MERLRDSLDPTHLSIWRRARREGLPKGRQNCNGPDAFSREPDQNCPCQFCHVLSVIMKKKKNWVGSEAEICWPLFPLQSKWEGRWCLIEELISLATNKAKLRFLFPLIFFWSLKGRQQLLPPGFIMSKRKLIGYWIRFSEVQLKKVNPFSFLFFFLPFYGHYTHCEANLYYICDSFYGRRCEKGFTWWVRTICHIIGVICMTFQELLELLPGRLIHPDHFWQANCFL